MKFQSEHYQILIIAVEYTYYGIKAKYIINIKTIGDNLMFDWCEVLANDKIEWKLGNYTNLYFDEINKVFEKYLKLKVLE